MMNAGSGTPAINPRAKGEKMKTFSELVAEHGIAPGSMITVDAHGNHAIGNGHGAYGNTPIFNPIILCSVASAEWHEDWLNNLGYDFLEEDSPENMKRIRARNTYQAYFRDFKWLAAQSEQKEASK